ncbi:MAG: bifunctional dihydropteridine reductase/dihydrofolate reductase TmpR [Microcystaceae cyanobacterium]
MLKKALVTGSAKGIGRAIALDLAQKGFDVAFHYRKSKEAANQACLEAAKYNIKAIALEADLTQSEQAQSLIDEAAEQLGGLSVIINNVGNYLDKAASQTTLEEWQDVMDSNLNATFSITQRGIPYLKQSGWGRIINFACASAQQVKARTSNMAYIIAKTGIIIYTKSLAREIIADGITANVIAPGIAENSFDLTESIPQLPTKRPATLQEITHGVWFFVNPDSDYITGQVLEVSGGWNL